MGVSGHALGGGPLQRKKERSQLASNLRPKKKRGWEVKKANNNLKTNEVSASKSEISSGLLLFPFFFF